MFTKTQNAFSNAHTEELFLKLLQKNIKIHVTGLHMEAQNKNNKQCTETNYMKLAAANANSFAQD